MSLLSTNSFCKNPALIKCRISTAFGKGSPSQRPTSYAEDSKFIQELGKACPVLSWEDLIRGYLLFFFSVPQDQNAWTFHLSRWNRQYTLCRCLKGYQISVSWCESSQSSRKSTPYLHKGYPSETNRLQKKKHIVPRKKRKKHSMDLDENSLNWLTSLVKEQPWRSTNNAQSRGVSKGRRTPLETAFCPSHLRSLCERLGTSQALNVSLPNFQDRLFFPSKLHIAPLYWGRLSTAISLQGKKKIGANKPGYLFLGSGVLLSLGATFP